MSTATPHYPQGNEKDNASDKTILSNIKKSLDSKQELWSLVSYEHVL